MLDAIQVILLLFILFSLFGLRNSTQSGAGSGSGAVNGLRERMDGLERSIDAVRASIDALHTRLGEMRQDHDILDELEDSVMEEWTRIIEEKLGKKPLRVPCPTCGSTSGLEPNLLTDEDSEYGCPNCGNIVTIDVLRQTYPNEDL